MTEFTLSSTAGHNSAFIKMCSAKKLLGKISQKFSRETEKDFLEIKCKRMLLVTFTLVKTFHNSHI